MMTMECGMFACVICGPANTVKPKATPAIRTANPLAHWWERARERVSPRAEGLVAKRTAGRRRATAALRFNAPSAAMPHTARCRTTLSPTPLPQVGEGLEAVAALA